MQGERLFCDSGVRPPVQAMIAFIDDHRGAHGVEPICKVLPIAPSTYHAHVAKRRDPAKRSARRAGCRSEGRGSSWVDWFNNRRLLESTGNIPPAEAEQRCYAMLE